MSTPEGKIKAKLKDWLRLRGAYFFMPVQTGYGATSLDFLVCLKGAFYGFECKVPGAHLTPRQEMVARQMTAAGAAVFKVTTDKTGNLEFTPCGSTSSEGS